MLHGRAAHSLIKKKGGSKLFGWWSVVNDHPEESVFTASKKGG